MKWDLMGLVTALLLLLIDGVVYGAILSAASHLPFKQCFCIVVFGVLAVGAILYEVSRFEGKTQ